MYASHVGKAEGIVREGGGAPNHRTLLYTKTRPGLHFTQKSGQVCISSDLALIKCMLCAGGERGTKSSHVTLRKNQARFALVISL